MSGKKIVGHIDSNGEIHEGAALALIFPKRKNGFGEGWIAMAQPALMALATGNLGEEAYRVFFAVISMLDFENWIQLNQSELSERLNLKRQNFNRAIQKLEGEKILLRGPKFGRSLTFRLNPNYGWKGSAKKHNEALKQKMNQLGMFVVDSEPYGR
jgi:hypothetical protein